jgi:hypothetical protein
VSVNTAFGKTRAPDVTPSRWLRTGFWICIVIAVVVVLRRVVAIAHAALTLAHLSPAWAFVLLTPSLYTRRFAGAAWPKRLLFPLGLMVGVTAYAMSRYSIGGWVERSAVLFFNTLFLFSLLRAWSLRQHAALYLRWMTRAVAVLLGIATTRPVMGIFFATSRATHLSPHQFFGIAFWIGFSINTVVIEFWLRSETGKSQIESMATTLLPQ